MGKACSDDFPFAGQLVNEIDCRNCMLLMKRLLVHWNEIWLILSIQWKIAEKSVADKNSCQVEGVENSSRRTLHIFPRSQFLMSYHPSLPYWVLWVFFRIVRFRQKIHKHVYHRIVREIRGHTFSTYASMRKEPKCVYLYQWKKKGAVAFCQHVRQSPDLNPWRQWLPTNPKKESPL